MKNKKKFISILLVMALLFTVVTTTSFAEMEGNLTGGSINVTNAVAGQTYSAYQILYLESYNNDSGAYSYKANSAWADWLATQTQYVTIDKDGYVTWVKGADAAAFAKLAAAQLSGKTADGTATVAEGATTATISNLNLGYYLVDTTLGTLCSLDTTSPNVDVKEKNEAPVLTKKVQEDSDNSWGATNDADINQVVKFQATITVQTGAENYIMHDTMSSGLTFNPNSVAVTVGNAPVDAANYTVTFKDVVSEDATSSDPADGCTFEIAFTDSYVAGLPKGTEIVVTYSATLNENAVVGLDGNTNKAILEYGDKTETGDITNKTPEEVTTTYTWDAKVIKYTVVDGKETMLAGAEFKITSDEAGNNVLAFDKVTTNSAGKTTYRYCDNNDEENENHVIQITTDATGTFVIEGLDSGTYYLHETAAPDGYNQLTTPVEVKIVGATRGDNGTLTYSTVETKVENKTGAELPSTGGMGTTLFYVVGGVMVLAAAVLLVTRKRMN